METEMQQHLMAAYYPNNVTSDHIQQYLDENKSLILKIVESQNTGKLSECAENQARLQRNLMYLAAIADSQSQPTTMHPQMASSGIMQAGAHYMQHQQAQQMTPQSLMAARPSMSSMLYSQQPLTAFQHQAALHSHLGTSSAGLLMLQSEGSARDSVGAGFGRDTGASKQDIGNPVSSEGRGGSSGGQSGENLYLKSADDVN